MNASAGWAVGATPASTSTSPLLSISPTVKTGDMFLQCRAKSYSQTLNIEKGQETTKWGDLPNIEVQEIKEMEGKDAAKRAVAEEEKEVVKGDGEGPPPRKKRELSKQDALTVAELRKMAFRLQEGLQKRRHRRIQILNVGVMGEDFPLLGGKGMLGKVHKANGWMNYNHDDYSGGVKERGLFRIQGMSAGRYEPRYCQSLIFPHLSQL